MVGGIAAKLAPDFAAQVNAMLGRLAQHSMFAEPGALDRLKMCADCRVVDLITAERSVDIRDV